MFGDMGKMMGALGKIKTELPKLQEQLAVTLYTAEAGDGAVRATVNGKLLLVELELDPSLDMSVAGELITAAVSDAQTIAAQAARDAMTDMLGFEIPPGMDGVL
jgi:nucleoid-associated protein EbfC